MRSNPELARSCKREDRVCVNIILRKLYDIILSGEMKGLRGCECLIMGIFRNIGRYHDDHCTRQMYFLEPGLNYNDSGLVSRATGVAVPRHGRMATEPAD